MWLRNILNDFVKYWGSVLSAGLFLFVSSLFALKILGPTEYGAWTALTFILLYGRYIHLGISNAMEREIAFYRGRGDLGQIDEIKNTAFSAVIIISIVSGIIVFALSLVLENSYPQHYIVTLRFIALILILHQVREWLLRYFAGTGNFTAVSTLRFLSGLFISSLIVFFVFRLNFIGIPLAVTLGNLLALLFIFIRYNPKINLGLNIKASLSLLTIGFPMVIVAIAFTLLFSIDRVLVFYLLGKAPLGYYGIACTLGDFLMSFSAVFARIVYISFSKQYGANGLNETLRQKVYATTILLAYALSMICACFYLIVPLIIKIGIPQYVPGIQAAKITSIGCFFLALSFIPERLLCAINQQMQLILFYFCALLFKFILSYYLIINHGGIEGVASSAAITYFLFSLFLISYSFNQLSKNSSRMITYLLKIYYPFIYVILVLAGFHYFLSEQILNSLNEIQHFLILFVLLIIIVIGPFMYSIKKIVINEDSYNVY